MKFILKVFVACLVGFAMMCIAIWYDASDRLAIGTYLATTITVATLLGAFDMPERTKQTSMNDAARHYDQAA